MSHIVTIQTKLKDPIAITAACRRLNLPTPILGMAELFSGTAEGVLVNLPEWNYPVVVNTATGECCFDNYEGKWGNQSHLDAFLQMYAVEKAKIEARKKGYTVNEQALLDGSIKVSIAVAT